MPLHWNVDHMGHLVTLKSEGALRSPEVTDYLMGVRAARALRYRKMFDARDGYTDMNEQELMSYAGAVVGCAILDPLGPYAVIVQDKSMQAHGSMLHQLLLPAGRSICMFWSPADAMTWLMAQPIPSSSA